MHTVEPERLAAEAGGGAGVDDVAAISDAPLVATHSNAHAVCPSPRNLTDRQLHMIRDTGGMVGLNYATFYLNADGRADAGTGWDTILRHLDNLIAELGEELARVRQLLAELKPSPLGADSAQEPPPPHY